MKTINVILSGGVGSRLWPLSRKSQPKQYIPFSGEKTLFQQTVERNMKFCDRLIVVGNQDNYQLSQANLKELGLTDYDEIIEACPRNTAAAIAFAAFSTDPDDILFVSPSDHLIIESEAYTSALNRAIELAQADYIVTLGLKPNKPETGFGYIEIEGEDVKTFKEKPDLETAQYFMDSGKFLWNSGMFCFKAKVFLEELKKYEPELYKAALETFQGKEGNFLAMDKSLLIPSISVDYAVMEKTEVAKVVKAEFEWSDLGTFNALYDHLISKGHQQDEHGNVVIGSKIHTEFLGLKNTILVVTADAILVLNKSNSQDVKKIFEKLEKDLPALV